MGPGAHKNTEIVTSTPDYTPVVPNPYVLYTVSRVKNGLFLNFSGSTKKIRSWTLLLRIPPVSVACHANLKSVQECLGALVPESRDETAMG